MTQQDAKFEDGDEQPIALRAKDGEDLAIISTLVQDAILPITEITWKADENRFGLLLNRFRWEDKTKAQKQGRDFERVQTVLVFDAVLAVASNGIDLSDKDQVISLLSIDFEADGDGAGSINLILAGDGMIALDVESIQATLKDVTRPYVAPSKKSPEHDLS
ncbi:hypothetical protein BFP76_02485 [Amylibacter kogurei]|uniref:DUF2948 domain-containing protein n=1 Tax=Paramylibacter kogurei TaxID=1889778 RepID=A0A2G5K3K5_9RHOB|nr:DUF2948 family protein [Amylibacter kogurei]PIB24127.1 hypothetical protein BFP76_02485 [Amylibacter kogurei]